MGSGAVSLIKVETTTSVQKTAPDELTSQTEQSTWQESEGSEGSGSSSTSPTGGCGGSSTNDTCFLSDPLEHLDDAEQNQSAAGGSLMEALQQSLLSNGMGASCQPVTWGSTGGSMMPW